MNKRNRLILANIFWILFFFSPTHCSAQEQKYVIDGYEFSAEPHHKILDDSHLTILGFTIGEHSLEDIQNKLGRTEILPAKEQAPVQICYRSNQKSDRTIIVFEAGPMGSWKYLTTFRLISNKVKFSEKDKCKTSTVVFKNIQTESGIKLGINPDQLRAILGKPTKEINDNIFFLYEAQRRLLEKETRKMDTQQLNERAYPVVDISSYVHATFLNSKMVSISITKIETY